MFRQAAWAALILIFEIGVLYPAKGSGLDIKSPMERRLSLPSDFIFVNYRNSKLSPVNLFGNRTEIDINYGPAHYIESGSNSNWQLRLGQEKPKTISDIFCLYDRKESYIDNLGITFSFVIKGKNQHRWILSFWQIYDMESSASHERPMRGYEFLPSKINGLSGQYLLISSGPEEQYGSNRQNEHGKGDRIVEGFSEEFNWTRREEIQVAKNMRVFVVIGIVIGIIFAVKFWIHVTYDDPARIYKTGMAIFLIIGVLLIMASAHGPH